MRLTHSISAAAVILASGIFLSRLLGYAREMLLAWQFGAGGETDAFYAAFQLPDLLNYFLAGGALSIAFIPMYNKARVQGGDAAADDLMAVVLGTLGLAAVLATAALWWYAGPLVAFQFPRFDAQAQALTTGLTRIVLPAQFFFITGGIVQAVLLARRHFIAAAVAPLVYNACTIAGGLLLYRCCGIAGFAWGALAGAVLGPFLVPVLFGFRHISLRMRVSFTDGRFLRYLALAAPLMLGQTLMTLDEWYGRWFGALLDEGTVAHISYARKLMHLPIALIGQAVAAAALPALSQMWAEGRVEEMNRTLLQTLRAGLALAVLAGAGMFALSGPLVALVYEHGAFTHGDSVEVSALAALLGFAIPGWIVQQIAARGFYARGDTLRPMVLGTLLALSVIPLYLWLSGRMGAQGLALAGVAGMSLNALATLLLMHRLHGTGFAAPLLGTFLRAVAGTAPAVALAWLALLKRPPLPQWGAKMEALAGLAGGGLVFVLVALPCMYVFADRDTRDYLKKVIRRGC